MGGINAENRNLNEVQQQLLDLLRVYVDICDRNDLKYFVAGGTALGTLRHHGFIPWDDDLDVTMPRPDFERLCGDHADVELPKRYSIHTSRDLLFGTFDDLSIRIQHGDEEWDRKQPHLSIDIFPLDGTPNNPVLRFVHRIACFTVFALIKIKRIQYIQRTEGMKNRKSRPLMERMLIRAGGAINVLLRRVDEDRLVDLFFALISKYSYETAKVAGTFTGRYRSKEFFPKIVFGEGVMYDFEGEKVRTYSGVKEYLERIYGSDYMVPPSEDGRERHGDLRIVHMDGDDC